MSSTHQNLHPETILGFCDGYPKCGDNFVIVGEPLTDPANGVRVITTTPVKEIVSRRHGVLVFRTENSVYELAEEN